MESTRHPGPGLNQPDKDLSHKSSDAWQSSPTPTATPLEVAIERTSDWLMARQHADGHWVAELEGDTILESEYILLLAFLGRHESPAARKAAEYIRQQQLPGGGWAIFPGGSVDISASARHTSL
jgi:squalene-hopene/tetraprenyl-beta-curcumene cyclase